MAYLVAKEAVHYYCSASVLQISQVLALKFISIRNQTTVYAYALWTTIAHPHSIVYAANFAVTALKSAWRTAA